MVKDSSSLPTIINQLEENVRVSTRSLFDTFPPYVNSPRRFGKQEDHACEGDSGQ